MILITGTITFDPAHADAAAEAAHQLVTATRQEPGNIQYGMWFSPNEPGTLTVVEEWADDDSLNSHMAAPHMADFLTAAGGFGITATDIWRYDVSDKTKFM